MRQEDLLIEVRAPNLNRLGVILAGDVQNFKATILHNAVGEWELHLEPDLPLVTELAKPGAGIIVSDPGGELFSGPMTGVSYEATDTNPYGAVVFTGLTDDVLLNDRQVLPSPTNPPDNQPVSHDVRTGNVESLMHAYTVFNLGLNAMPGRLDKRVTMGVNLARGPRITKRVRFGTIGETLVELGKLGGLGFRLIQRRLAGVEKLVFETYEVTDRSDLVRLSIWNHTVARENVTIAAPTATDIIVAGQGELTERTFISYTDDLAQQAVVQWNRRIEKFVDQRQTDDEGQYVQRASEILEDEGRTHIAVQIVPVDDSYTMTFGTDWNIGDIVGVDTAFGSYDALASGFVIALSPDAGLRFGVQIGEDPTPTDTSRLDDLVARIGQLERSL